jgi:hypothetical protein
MVEQKLTLADYALPHIERLADTDTGRVQFGSIPSDARGYPDGCGVCRPWL